MFSIIGDGIMVESAVLEKDVQFMMEDVKARGYDKVESRRMEGEKKEFRSIAEIREDENSFPDNPMEGDLQTLEYFGER